MNSILAYLTANWIEFLGALLSLIYLYLSIKQKVSLWIFGFLCSALYVVVFFNAQLYADMSLQFYYLAISVFGWINWNKEKQKTGNEMPTSKTSLRLWLALFVATLIIYLIYYIILSKFTDSPVPKSDSLVGALSVIATWMLARKLLENWLVWILADALCIALFIYKELYLTSALFVIYTIMAVFGYVNWKKSMK